MDVLDVFIATDTNGEISTAQQNGLGMKLGFLGCQRQAVPRD